VLVRDWGGVTHQAQVLENGVLFRSKRYNSLSEVARIITGTRWSGPLDCGTALCQLTEAHRQQRVRVPRLSVTPNHLRKFRYCQVLTRRRIAFKYYDRRTYREPLGVEASKRTRVDAERLSSTIQLELSAGTFDYAKRFPNSGRVKALGLKRPEQRSKSNPERIFRGRLVAREAPRGKALDVCVLQRDLQTSHRKGRDREEAPL
jgi:hypothetical protein